MLVVGVKFKSSGKIYYFDSNNLELKLGDKVIVDSSQGLDIGVIQVVEKEIDPQKFEHELSQVVRVADDEDLYKDHINKTDSKNAIGVCQERADNLGLKMNIVDAAFTFDRQKLLIFFISEKRVDFRHLVKELAAIYKNRIELRQIGVRDHAKMLQSLGICGQQCCCSRFINEFSPLSVKMAKEQNMTLDPAKILGMCGRLMCCISFENEAYKYAKKIMPKVGQRVKTKDGNGYVLSNNYVTEECKVRIHIESEDQDFEKYYCHKEIEIEE